jgi:single-strand DNA-binding protein
MEKSINKVELRGYLGVEPTMFSTKNGNKLARSRMATTEFFKNREGEWVDSTTWHQIIFWGNLADKACEELRKGGGLTLSGKITNRQYTGADGRPRYVSEIIVQSFEPTQMQVVVKEKDKIADTAPFMA